MAHAALVEPNPWMILPFALLLGLIALGPLLLPHWWHRHYPKVAFVLAAVTGCYYVVGLEAYARVFGAAHEYLSFVAMVGALFVVSGGIHINVKGEATPAENVLFLLVGALLSNVIGTTGASMLMIRPWIRMNKYRVTAHHIVFFIFIVSNVGGCLTPVGDPPLYLGYLKGVPFWWVARQCFPMWAVGMAYLLAVFYFLDLRNYRRAPLAVREKLAEPPDEWKLDGLGNLFFLGVILAAVFVDKPAFLREALMLGAAAGSYLLTKKSVHESNAFDFGPIKEVAVLFVGIFATMMPALDWLQGHGAKLGSASPSFFYWASGSLSSVLDNAPTYLSFLEAMLGAVGREGAEETAKIAGILASPGLAKSLAALSVAAVFFGANTYIGNGPNFMVKAIADQNKVHCPAFLGYILKYSLPVMGTMLLLIWALFFRG